MTPRAGSRPGAPLVEFFGLPGSGKTTLAAEVFRRLSVRAPGMLFGPDLIRDGAGGRTRAAAKALLVARTAADRGALSLPLSAAAVRQPGTRDRIRAAATVASVLGQYAAARRAGAGAVLDQGLLQAAWTLRFRSDDPAAHGVATRLLDRARKNGAIVVFVDTPPETCYRRLHSRSSRHSRMQMAGTGDPAEWVRANDVLSAILSEFRSMVPAPASAVLCDGTDGVGPAVDGILAGLGTARILQGPGDGMTGAKAGPAGTANMRLKAISFR